MHKGRPVLPSAGFGRPAEISGLHPYGVREVVVAKIADLESIDSKTHGAMIASTVGMKKKVELLKAAKEKGITILNVKDGAALQKSLEDKFIARKAEKKKRSENKKKKDEEKKKVEVKESKKSDKTVEGQSSKATSSSTKSTEKKEEERKLAEKVITKKQ